MEGNTETAAQKYFIKVAVLKNVWKIPKKTPVRRSFLELEAEVKAMDFFLRIFRKFSEQLRLDKIFFKEQRFRQTVGGNLKAGISLIAEY